MIKHRGFTGKNPPDLKCKVLVQLMENLTHFMREELSKIHKNQPTLNSHDLTEVTVGALTNYMASILRISSHENPQQMAIAYEAVVETLKESMKQNIKGEL